MSHDDTTKPHDDTTKPQYTQYSRNNFGVNVAAARTLKRLTQAQLAQKANLGKSTIEQIEKHNKNITIDTMLAIAKATGQSLDFFFTSHT